MRFLFEGATAEWGVDNASDATAGQLEKLAQDMESAAGSLSEILCVKHNMSCCYMTARGMYAKQDDQEANGSGAAQHYQEFIEQRGKRFDEH